MSAHMANTHHPVDQYLSAGIPGGIEPGEVTAFLTDSTLCIGCKACEVACKEWNGLDADGLELTGFSYDNTVALGHSTWRHVKFIEGAPEPGIGGNNPQRISWAFRPTSASIARWQAAWKRARRARWCVRSSVACFCNRTYATDVRIA